MGMVKTLFKKSSPVRKGIARGLGFLIASYGLYAFFKREIGSYMLLKTQFAYFDLDEPLTSFLLDYVAVMGLFVFLGHYLAGAAKKISRNTSATKHDG